MSTPDDFHEIEMMLGDLPLREPSMMLDERINNTLHTASTVSAQPYAGHRTLLRFTGIAAMITLSAAVIIGFAMKGENASVDTPSIAGQLSDAPAAQTPKPINLTWSRDVAEEIRYTPAGKPYRAVVQQTIDQRVWVDPETGARMQVSVPRKELYIAEQLVF